MKNAAIAYNSKLISNGLRPSPEPIAEVSSILPEIPVPKKAVGVDDFSDNQPTGETIRMRN